MGKNPAFLLYPGDWSRDLEEHPLEVEGAWIRLCCKLWWQEVRGKSVKNLDEWSRILHIKRIKTFKLLTYLQEKNIGNIYYFSEKNLKKNEKKLQKTLKNYQKSFCFFSENNIKSDGFLPESLTGIGKNDLIIIESRRMLSNDIIRENERLKKWKQRNPEGNNNQENPGNVPDDVPEMSPPFFHSSVLSSVSDINNKEKKNKKENYFSPLNLAELWNEITGKYGLPVMTIPLTAIRIKDAESRLKEQPDKEYWENLINYMVSDPFYRGKNDRKWKPRLDYLLKDDTNHVKVFEEMPKVEETELTPEEVAEHEWNCYHTAVTEGLDIEKCYDGVILEIHKKYEGKVNKETFMEEWQHDNK